MDGIAAGGHAEDKHKKIRENFRKTQRVAYFIKRYLIFAVILVPSLIYLHYVDITRAESSLLVLLVTRICRSTVGVLLAMLFSKFAFPKIALQTELIEDQNIAIALIFAAIIIGVNL